MDERQIALDRARARLELWEDRLANLTKPGEEMYAQYTQELMDRLEAVRIKHEKLRRAEGSRFEVAREEVERAFSALQTAWDTTVAKLAWTNPLAK